jgi:capsule polysaccharide export protein KpsE/RkpR
MLTELRALRAELSRMESSAGGGSGSAFDLPVGKLPEAAIDYIRARRELKLQEALLETMLRQFEVAKLDEAKEGPPLQVVDVAMPPDRKSKPARSLIVVGTTLAALFAAIVWALIKGYLAWARREDPQAAQRWRPFRAAWQLRR